MALKYVTKKEIKEDWDRRFLLDFLECHKGELTNMVKRAMEQQFKKGTTPGVAAYQEKQIQDLQKEALCSGAQSSSC